MARKKLGELLVEEGAVERAHLDEALSQTGETRIGQRLVDMGVVADEAVARALARQLGLPYVDPLQARVDHSLLRRMPQAMTSARRVLPLTLENGVLTVAVSDPLNLSLVDDLQFIFRARVKAQVAAPSKLRRAFDREGDLAPHAQRMLAGVRPSEGHEGDGVMRLDEGEIVRRLEAGGQRPYVDLASLLIVQAANRGASDIHLEPQSDGLRVRMRTDGMLRVVLSLPRWSAGPLVSRIKVLAELDVANHRTPQDGKFRVHVQGRRVDLRVAVVPSQFGEKVVIRLLDPRMLQTDLGTLGWEPRALQQYYHMVSRPRGLVLCVGPTGSGKTTTLYATIHRLRNDTASIVTVEDPIEYTLDGVVQLEVHERSGLTFAKAVRSLLRQDANVVVVGEVRDAETALAAVQAATTGHLVLSTLHTTQAVSTVVRLLELGIPPYLLGDALSGVVAQRLLRRVCPECSIEGPAEAEDWERFGIPPQPVGDRIRRVGPGCSACDYVGYRGRVGVFEVLSITDDVRAQILDGLDERKLWALAREQGLTTLFDDALTKVAQGLTTLEEVARVVPVDPWRQAEPAVNPFAGTQPLTPVAPRPDVGLEDAPTEAPPAAEPVAREPVEPVSAPAPRRVVRIESPAPEPAAPTPAPAPVDARPLVLVVDDAEEIRQLVSVTLEDDYRIVTASDGLEALAAVKAHSPDLMVLDVMMPHLSGYDVCDRLKADPATATLPVIMLSARGQRGHVKEGLRRGADDYLPKPFDPEELELRVRALLRRAGRPPA